MKSFSTLLFLSAALVVSACTPEPVEELPPLDESKPIYGAAGPVEYVTDCKPQEAQKLLWQPQAALDQYPEIKARARIIMPGMLVIQDYRPSRLNVVLGASGRIERVYCG